MLKIRNPRYTVVLRMETKIFFNFFVMYPSTGSLQVVVGFLRMMDSIELMSPVILKQFSLSTIDFNLIVSFIVSGKD